MDGGTHLVAAEDKEGTSSGNGQEHIPSRNVKVGGQGDNVSSGHKQRQIMRSERQGEESQCSSSDENAKYEHANDERITLDGVLMRAPNGSPDAGNYERRPNT